MNTDPDQRPASHPTGSPAGWLLAAVGAACLAYLLTVTGFIAWLAIGIGQIQGTAQQQCALDLTTAATAPNPTGTDNQTRPANVGDLTNQQMAVAQAIYTTVRTVANQHSWPTPIAEKAFLIATATAMKESTLGANPNSHRPDRNGDGGIYQQRTKPGWYGSINQVNDPTYGTRIFLTGRTVTSSDITAARTAGVTPAGPAGYTIPGLIQIHNWTQLTIGDASHRVQRSAYPHMPPAFEDLAHALWAAYSKRGDAATTADVAQDLSNQCHNAGDQSSALNCPPTSMPAEQYPLTPDGLLVTRCVAQQFRQVGTIGTYPGHQPDATRAVDIMIPGYTTAAGRALGLQIASWVQQHATQLGVDYVIWREHIWSVQRAGEGWRQCGTAAATCYRGPDDSAAHRNHVHVSVYGNRASGLPAATSTGCHLDPDNAPGRHNPNNCDQALKFLQDQMTSGSRQWYRSCLALVARAYGWGWSGVNTAEMHAYLLQRAGKLRTSRSDIPRGAILWWVNGRAGHVAIYDGHGYIYSNDVTGPGRVGRVRWNFPETNWGQHFLGWSAPYFPAAGGA